MKSTKTTKIFNIFIIILISFNLTGCFWEKDIVVKPVEKMYLKKYGSSKEELNFKVKKKTIKEETYFLIKDKDFNKLVQFVNQLKSNLKKYENQVEVYNKKEK